MMMTVSEEKSFALSCLGCSGNCLGPPTRTYSQIADSIFVSKNEFKILYCEYPEKRQKVLDQPCFGHAKKGYKTSICAIVPLLFMQLPQVTYQSLFTGYKVRDHF